MSSKVYSDATLSSVVALQDNLASLCADRPLVTPELFRLNGYYGMDRILKRYAGLPDDYHLKVALPHGPGFARTKVWRGLAHAPLPALWCYPRYLRLLYERASNKKVIVGASPFLYLLRMLDRVNQGERKGTIFFPAHSTRFLTVNDNPELMVARLQELPVEYHPVTVCMYWQDFLQGRHVPFESAGFRIVSAGHMFDPEFLVRFYYLCALHRYAASNTVASPTFYSIKAGCSFFLLDCGPVARLGPARYEAESYGFSIGSNDRMRRLFTPRHPQATPRQLKVSDYFLGSNYVLSPIELREMLLQLEMADALGYFRKRPDEAPRFIFSPRLKREVAHARHRLRTSAGWLWRWWATFRR